MSWNEYHKKRKAEFYAERKIKGIRQFSDEDKISLAEAGATCYDPRGDSGWGTREWLESISCVLHHGCCNGCDAVGLCEKLSKGSQ